VAKAMVLLIAFVVIFFCIILFKGSSVVAPSDEPSSIEMPSLPDLNIKDKAAAAGEKLKEGAKVLAHKAGALTEIKPLVLTVDRELIEVTPGKMTEVKVTRSGGELKAEKLELIPAPGSKLTASGGDFKAGEHDTVVFVESESGAQAAGLTIKSGTAVKVVPVRIKTP
jgi:hypothetical protein